MSVQQTPTHLNFVRTLPRTRLLTLTESFQLDSVFEGFNSQSSQAQRQSIAPYAENQNCGIGMYKMTERRGLCTDRSPQGTLQKTLDVFRVSRNFFLPGTKNKRIASAEPGASLKPAGRREGNISKERQGWTCVNRRLG